MREEIDLFVSLLGELSKVMSLLARTADDNNAALTALSTALRETQPR